jgi:octaprenyl-diphosphate synthase
MSAACELGSLGQGSAEGEAMALFGHNLGMAFQIADDLLDYTGSEDETGKPTGHDLRERKVTLPLIGAMERASEAEVREIRGFFTRLDPTDEEILRVVDIVGERGGLEYARRRAADYAELAEGALEGRPESAAAAALRGAVRYAVARTR